MNISGPKLLFLIETYDCTLDILAVLKSFNREFNSPKVETVKSKL